MSYLFTSEYVSPGHPDKCADIIADSILDSYLKFDKDSRVACEVMIAGNTVTLGGEISSKIHYDKEDLENIVINTLINIGYTNDSLFTDEQCIKPRNIKVVNLLRKQSPDINQGVDKKDGELGAGDQGIMFGFASKECEHNYMPYAISAAKEVCDLLYKFALNNKNYGIDIKTQVTVDYGTEDNFNNCIPLKITDLVVSIPTVEDLDFQTSLKEIDEYLRNNLPDWISDKITKDTKLHYNNTGRYVNHSALHDCGVTGRKLIVDTFGGYSVIGGGAQCFTGDTLVKTDKGLIPIKDIKVGDWVWVGNIDNPNWKFKIPYQVSNKIEKDATELLELELESGNIIRCTPDHIFYTSNRGEVKAIDLNEEDDIIEFKDLKSGRSLK